MVSRRACYDLLKVFRGILALDLSSVLRVSTEIGYEDSMATNPGSCGTSAQRAAGARSSASTSSRFAAHL